MLQTCGKHVANTWRTHGLGQEGKTRSKQVANTCFVLGMVVILLLPGFLLSSPRFVFPIGFLYTSGSQAFSLGGSLAKSRFSQGSQCKILRSAPCEIAIGSS